MQVQALLLALALALAGCSSARSDPTLAAPGTTSTSTAQVPAAPPVPVDFPVEWDGHLVTGAWACDAVATRTCHAQPAAAFGVERTFDGFMGNLTEGTLTLTWTAVTPVTQTMDFEVFLTNRSCQDECDLWTTAKTGPSPLVANMPGGLLLAADHVLRLVVYPGVLVAYQGNAAGLSADQDFQVAGSLALVP